MPKEFVTASIALLGVLISTFLSWLTARRTTATELRKQQLQLFGKYAETLQQKRLIAYSESYELVSSFEKEIRRGVATRRQLRETLSQFQQWDSANALLLSQRASNAIYTAQWQLIEIASLDSDQISESEVAQILSHLERIELVLKEDIGVFAVEYEDQVKLSSYMDKPQE